MVQLSTFFNVSDITIYLWEKNKVQPSLAQIPKIIEFLGRVPFEKSAEKMGDKLREYRRVHGLSQKKLANNWESIYRRWPDGKTENTSRLKSYLIK